MTVPEPTGRRALLGALASTFALGGCLGTDGLDAGPSYERASIDVDGDPRTAEELTAAAALAEREAHAGATSLAGLDLLDHEFVLEDGYLGATIQGTVENTGDDRVETAEVRTRVYDDDGAQLGRYVDRTGGLEGGGTWSFQVVVLESPDDLGAYEVAAVGEPA